MSQSLEFDVLTPAIGAEVKGLDLAALESYEHLAEPLADLLHEHHVLFFRQQELSPVQMKHLASIFGDLHIHPLYPNHEDAPEIIVLDTHNDNPPDNDNWHTDVTFIDKPPMGAVLSARMLPSTGGDTLWTSCIAAYEALSKPMQTMLEGLTASHDIRQSFPQERYGATPEDLVKWQASVEKHPPISHPVIRTHPVTGRKGVFVNEGFTTRINELTKKESDTLLNFLCSFVAKPEFSIRWKWKEYDLAIWDNRLTQHYATNDYMPQRRIMYRATILGDVPR